MHDSPESHADESRRHRPNDYDDPHYHDEDDEVPGDDVNTRDVRPTRRKSRRRPPPYRPHYED